MAFSYNKKNLANTTITGAITPTQTSVTVADATVFSYAFFYATLMPSNEMSNASNSEIVLVTNIQGNTLTLVRGQENTIARSFPYGAVITNGIYTRDIDYARSIGRKVFMAQDDGTDNTNTSYQINDPMIKNVPEEGSIITVEFDTPSYGSPTLGVNNGIGGLVQVSGTDIHITDSSGQIDSVEMYGDTEQTTYSGKNLFDVSLYDGITQNDDGTVKSTKYYGAATAVSLNLEPSTRYTISIRDSNGELNGQGWGIAVNGTWINTTSGTGAVTTDANGDVTLTVGASSYGAIGGYNALLQLEAGSTATDYEPYVGGTASPNPDYPQEVKTVTGRQVVTISDGDSQSQEYEINLGKNLFDGTYVKYAIGGTEQRQWFSASTCRSMIIPCQPSTTYTVTKFTAGNRFTICDYPTLPTQNVLLNSLFRDQDMATGSVTVTTHSDAAYLMVFVSNEDTEPQVQVEKGSAATTYAPYFTPIELCKIGTYQDYIYKSGEDWYVHKEITKITLDGSENWRLYSGNSFFVILLSMAFPVDAFVVSYSNNYKGVENCGTSPEFIQRAEELGLKYAIDVHRTSRYVRIIDADCTTAAQLSTKLSTNNTVLYYPLATPTDTQITNATLIAQLEALNNMLPEGVADVVVTGDLPGSLTIKYYQQGTGTYTAPIVGGAEIDGGDNEQVVELDSYLPYRLVYDTNGYWRVLNKGPKVTTGAIADGAVTADKITPDNINYGTTSSDIRIGTFNGDPLYRKVETFTNLPRGFSQHTFANGDIANMKAIIRIDGSFNSSGTWIPVNSLPPDNVTGYGIAVRDVTYHKWAAVSGTSMSATNNGYVIIDYTTTS